MPKTPGCVEHHHKLTEVIKDAKPRHKSLAVYWLDLANAYGSVYHSLISFSLRHYGAPLATTDSAFYSDLSAISPHLSGPHPQYYLNWEFTKEIPCQRSYSIPSSIPWSTPLRSGGIWVTTSQIVWLVNAICRRHLPSGKFTICRSTAAEPCGEMAVLVRDEGQGPKVSYTWTKGFSGKVG